MITDVSGYPSSRKAVEKKYCNLQAKQIDVLRRIANEHFGTVMTVSY